MKIIFMGRKKQAAENIEWTLKQGIQIAAVVTDSQFHTSPTAIKARELQIPVITLEEAEALISKDDHGIDLVISYLFWRKIKEPLISGPQFGCINFHPAILPKWRGTAGYNMAILSKLNEWGATAHYINEQIDAGDIIRTYKFSFDFRLETAQSLEQKTQSVLSDLYKSIILDVLDKGILESYSQSLEDGIYISRNEMNSMKKIDPDNDDIDLKIRAFWFPPYDGAYIEINGRKYTLINEFILKNLADNTDTNNA